MVTTYGNILHLFIFIDDYDLLNHKRPVAIAFKGIHKIACITATAPINIWVKLNQITSLPLLREPTTYEPEGENPFFFVLWQGTVILGLKAPPPKKSNDT